MNAWQIVLLIVVIVLAVALIGWALSRRQMTAKRETQAREHLNEARERQARAESTRAAAEEKAAQLRRERAELEQRAAQQEREAAQLAEDADRDEARAAELQARARKLAPQLADEDTTAARDTTPLDGHAAADTAGYADTRGFDAHRDSRDRVDGDGDGGGDGDTLLAPRPSPSHEYRDTGSDSADDAGTAHPDREPATAYRHTAPVTDPDATTEDVAEDGTYRNPGDGAVVDRQTVVDRDGDGYADGDPADGDRPSLKERLTGRPERGVDERDVAVEDQDVTDATRRRQ
jgi:uncharacterized protein YneF (UPF0154 family)